MNKIYNIWDVGGGLGRQQEGFTLDPLSVTTWASLVISPTALKGKVPKNETCYIGVVGGGVWWWLGGKVLKFHENENYIFTIENSPLPGLEGGGVFFLSFNHQYIFF